jgi:hypothetical protein
MNNCFVIVWTELNEKGYTLWEYLKPNFDEVLTCEAGGCLEDGACDD